MGERRFDEAVAAAWGKFEAELEARLLLLDDGPLLIKVEAETTGEGTTPYVQFYGGDIVRAEVSSNKFLDSACRLDTVQRRALRAIGWRRPDEDHPNYWVDVERGEIEVLHSMTMGALRQALGVVHPLFLNWSGEPDVASPGECEHELGFPTSPDEVRVMVEATLLAHLGVSELKTDDDGDYPIRHGKVPLWVRVLEDSPTVRIFSHIVVNVRSTQQARVEVDILNRQHKFLKFAVLDRTVIATIDVPASPYVAQHVRDMFDLAGTALNELVDDLALRTGGRRFFSSPPQPRLPGAA